MATVSNYLLGRFTDTFELMEPPTSFEGEVSHYFVNGGYVYVWSSDNKILIPPTTRSDGTSLPQEIERGSKISKLSGSSQLYLVNDDETILYTMLEL